MRTKLMNSAMMPHAGHYECVQITKEEFIDTLRREHQQGDLESFVGYPQNVDLIEKWSGVRVELNRGQTTFGHGDRALVMKLNYRAAPGTKGREVRDEDFSFFLVRYWSYLPC